MEKLLADARDAVWREYPAEGRTLAAARKQLQFVFDRNMKIWSAIKKPSPAAFFENLHPSVADRRQPAMGQQWRRMEWAGDRSDLQSHPESAVRRGGPSPDAAARG